MRHNSRCRFRFRGYSLGGLQFWDLSARRPAHKQAMAAFGALTPRSRRSKVGSHKWLQDPGRAKNATELLSVFYPSTGSIRQRGTRLL